MEDQETYVPDSALLPEDGYEEEPEQPYAEPNQESAEDASWEEWAWQQDAGAWRYWAWENLLETIRFRDWAWQYLQDVTYYRERAWQDMQQARRFKDLACQHLASLRQPRQPP
jgi:hypothetical protein